MQTINSMELGTEHIGRIVQFSGRRLDQRVQHVLIGRIAAISRESQWPRPGTGPVRIYLDGLSAYPYEVATDELFIEAPEMLIDEEEPTEKAPETGTASPQYLPAYQFLLDLVRNLSEDQPKAEERAANHVRFMDWAAGYAACLRDAGTGALDDPPKGPRTVNPFWGVGVEDRAAKETREQRDDRVRSERWGAVKADWSGLLDATGDAIETIIGTFTPERQEAIRNRLKKEQGR